MQAWPDVLKSFFINYGQLMLGWLLGMLSPAIIEEIRRRRRLDRLQRAMALELHELQFQMALKAFILRERRGRLDDEFLSWFERTIKTYEGNESRERFLALIPTLLSLPVQQRGNHDPKRGLSLTDANSPLLTIHTAEIALFPVPSQSALLNISQQVSIFNQQVSGLRRMFDRTFDNLSNTSRDSVMQNLEEGYQQLADRALLLAKVIQGAPPSLLFRGQSR